MKSSALPTFPGHGPRRLYACLEMSSCSSMIHRRCLLGQDGPFHQILTTRTVGRNHLHLPAARTGKALSVPPRALDPHDEQDEEDHRRKQQGQEADKDGYDDPNRDNPGGDRQSPGDWISFDLGELSGSLRNAVCPHCSRSQMYSRSGSVSIGASCWIPSEHGVLENAKAHVLRATTLMLSDAL